MTTNHHTPIANGAPADSATINAPLSELDTKITNHETRIGTLEAEFAAPSGIPTEYLNGEGNWTVPAGTGASVDGHVIKDEGVALPQRASINFVGAGVTVTNEAGGTQVEIPGGGHIIQDEGVDLANQPRLNFVGTGVTVTNDSDANKTVVTIPNDHGGFSGLADDDHPQYHNDARGDARYPRKYAGKTTAPTVNDDSGDGYAVGDKWLDETNDKEYVVLDVTVGAAVWKETTSTGGGLTLSIASVTTSNVTGVEGTHHVLDVSGMTANRDFNLPTPSAAGKTCKVSLSAGDNTYALIIKKNSTEITRIFITEETLEFLSTGTGAADWVLVQNGRKSSVGSANRNTAQSIPTATLTKVLLNNSVANVGDVVDIVTNNRINIRRTGLYSINALVAIAFTLDDQEQLQCLIYVNGVSDNYAANWVSAGVADRVLVTNMSTVLSLIAGDYVELWIYHTEGASQNTNTTISPKLSVSEIL